MEHPILSFQFKDTPPIAISIETRKEKGESYSALGGLYRRFELVYVMADERDVIRVRSNHRQGEDVYLYRTTMPATEVRVRFLEYIRSMNVCGIIRVGTMPSLQTAPRPHARNDRSPPAVRRI